MHSSVVATLSFSYNSLLTPCWPLLSWRETRTHARLSSYLDCWSLTITEVDIPYTCTHKLAHTRVCTRLIAAYAMTIEAHKHTIAHILLTNRFMWGRPNRSASNESMTHSAKYTLHRILSYRHHITLTFSRFNCSFFCVYFLMFINFRTVFLQYTPIDRPSIQSVGTPRWVDSDERIPGGL